MTTKPLSDELKAKWLAKLRGGEYQQGPTYLHNANADTYCCLGVLCALQGITWDSEDWVNDYATTFPPPAARHLDLEWPVDSGLLANMNDGRSGYAKHSFADIADYLEGKREPKLAENPYAEDEEY